MADAIQISAFLQVLTALGKRNIPSDIEFVRTNYIAHPDNVRCTVAHDKNDVLLGLQILKRASANNIYGVAVGWGIVGTHVNPNASRRGVGKLLFAVTKEAAQYAGLQKIDATIGATSAEALGYYEAMGFRTYETTETRVRKCYDVAL